ncbi:RagB/SusD family nutrient uptake outer membrane protein [Flavobacterium sp. MFBS3-15]|uniref:RagB/SusD family nutrient uptake outer membrane protein n=1 Tax=Flavobacterium sp. MFBS3-15 TaxID=2989816 RepID=UPI0022358CA9|nr:RagB/SusD family nutrient uptake outer membrane protein [Flavobacterium sp. MFBS3-15]MCW4468530.1 RagB/SusD family nutrient uptake outer membrane protein [Flavobacterium sp. MFBS3-15]
MKKKIIIAVAAFSLLSLNLSCGDDFVDRTPPYSIDSENYFNSEADYQQAIIAVYDMLQSTYQNVLLGEIASDNTLCGGESATDTPSFQQVDDMTHTPVNPELKKIWDWMFAGVNRANYILEFKDKTDFEGKEHIIAEARFLRAYFHFELVKWFGGIPMKGDARFKLGDETTIPRSTPEEVYASIEADLLYAIENIDPSPSQQGRVTKGAARALLGKAYLYWADTGLGHSEKFAMAAEVLEQVIQSNTYTLLPDYSTMFELTNENNAESVFEVQYTDKEGAGFDCLQCSEGNVAVGFNGPRGFDGPSFESGYSFNVPTQETYDFFEDGDLRRDVAILNMEAFVAANPNWVNSLGELGVLYAEGYEHTGFYNRKYIPRKDPVNDQNIGDANLTNPNNYRAIRYADVLLMAAEAYNRGQIDDVKARTYLNMVRTRAFGNSSHNITASGSALTQFIWDERRRELVGEGHRFFDLVRTKQAAAAIDGFVAGKHELFPIPIEEIQFSNGNWNQNPNY